ncbi:undecaprenyl phosphate N,N'-diacetylbacillosamine 1-phosphate transferase [Clostridia bacterium]|nr:undecaprenyl phosphate N,N'-diacetylbacillosamine 1-phosphate transferase [Clostridia bacterium]
MNRNVQLKVKRVFDLFLILVTCWATIPIFIIVAIIIKMLSPEDKIIFTQYRIGYKGEKFRIHKFRSMTNQRNYAGELLPDEQRLRLWGKIIRSLSIDEIPQIWDILCGSMSWIGPRPLLPHEMSVMTASEQSERQSMRPGITGWEAVNESRAETRRKMAEFDLDYVRKWSLWFDVKIFIQTALIVLMRLRPSDSLRAPKMDDEPDKGASL